MGTFWGFGTSGAEVGAGDASGTGDENSSSPSSSSSGFSSSSSSGFLAAFSCKFSKKICIRKCRIDKIFSVKHTHSQKGKTHKKQRFKINMLL